MAQDKSAEIINFNGAGDAPQSPVPVEPESEHEASAQTLEDIGAGAFLAQARHKAKLSIDQASEATKIKPGHLEAIEWMRFDRLPALPYATGFVKTYARYLGLDADAVAARFRLEAGAAAAALADDPATSNPSSEISGGEGARIGSVFAMLAVVLFALWIGYQVLTRGGENAADNQSSVQPRVTVNMPASRTVAPRTTEPETTAPQIIDTAPAQQPDAPVQTNTSLETTGETAPGGEDTALADEPVSALTDTAAPETQTSEAQITQSEVETAANEIPPVREEPVAQTRQAASEPRARPLPRRPQTPPPVIVESALARSVSPDYPNRCTRGARNMESVTIVFDVSAAGRAVNSRVESSTNSCFESEALRTLDRWRFEPRTVDGQAVSEAGKRATLNFRK